MKKIAFGTACGMTVIFVLTIMLTLYNRSVRQEEVSATLSQAMETALSEIMREPTDVVEKKEALTEALLKALLIRMNSDSNLTVSILEADPRLGILSVEAVETFRHPNGKTGAVSEVRTVILDRNREEKREERTVSFYVSGTLYKKYTLPKDSFCMLPLPPQQEGKIFCGWRFMNQSGQKADSVNVTGQNGSKEVLALGDVPYVVSEHTKLTAIFQ